MAKLTRKFLARYGANGVINDYAVFGSKAAAAPVNSLDVAAIQALAAWGTGLKDTLLAGQRAPFLEDDNAWRLVHAYMVCYLLQEGIPEWDGSTTYFLNSWVKKPGTNQLFSSKVDNNIGNAPPNLGTDGNWHLEHPIANDNILDGSVSTDKYEDASITDGKIVGMDAHKLLGNLLVDAATGIVSAPKQSSCFVARAISDQAVAGGDNLVLFDTVIFDTQSEFNTGTGKFTAIKGGIYAVTFRGTIDSNPSGFNLGICKNGVLNTINFLHSLFQVPLGTITGFVSALIKLAPGDYITGVVTVSGAGHSLLHAHGTEYYPTSMEIVKVA